MFSPLFLTGSAVEFGWAAGEGVMVPHLIGGLNLSLTMAGMIYVLNPCIGVIAQACLSCARMRD